jgi:arabinogalactan endo-1,4-beta-galactosidase
MIDFHYSDSWARSCQQFKPAAWENLFEGEMDFDTVLVNLIGSGVSSGR